MSLRKMMANLFCAIEMNESEKFGEILEKNPVLPNYTNTNALSPM